MEAVAALSLASNIIQIVDFTSRLISRSHELYNSTDGRVGEHAVLHDAARNLTGLYSDLQRFRVVQPKDLSAADKQLIELQTRTEDVVEKIRICLEEVLSKETPRRLQSIYQALKSMYADREISAFAKQLDDLRKQIDTALLVSLCEKISNTTEIHQKAVDTIRDQDVREVRERHAELLSAIRENNWHPSRSRDISALSKKVSSQAAADLETRFCKAILARLFFRHMPDRVDSIPTAHAKTFEWLFENKTCASNRPDADQDDWDDFPGWLREKDNSIYWITGKSGSGKSTLMKFLYHHHRLAELLDDWTPRAKLSKAGFYFWNSGAAMQMSRLGLLQSLLYSCFSENKELILPSVAERWEQFVAFGGGQDAFDWPELSRTFDQMISTNSRNFFFLIDGLDEFDGESKEIVQLILKAARPNVKLCIASRPWLPFEDAFGQKASLRLERLTKQDIALYVSGHFQSNEHYSRLLDCEPTTAKRLVPSIAEKASGVFLWVHLVVQSLLEGLSNADRVSDLEARLQALPSDLETLFNFILNRLEPDYFKQACELFRLLRTLRESRGESETLTLLGLYFADEADTSTSLHATCKPLSEKDALQRAEQMRRRVSARCKGLLEIQRDRIALRATRHLYDNVVLYLHRTARDFVESASYWEIVLQASGRDAFCAHGRLLNAALWLQKTHPSVGISTRLARQLRSNSIDFADKRYKMTGIVQATYLAEVFRTHHVYHLDGRNNKLPTTLDFPNFHFHIKLAPYCIVALSLLDSKDQSRASTILRSTSYDHTLHGLESRQPYSQLEIWINYYIARDKKRWFKRRSRKPPGAIPAYE